MEFGEKLCMLGPGRRGEQTVLEQQFILADDERRALGASGDPLPERLARLLETRGIPVRDTLEPAPCSSQDAQFAFGELFARLSLGLQRAAGHRVELWGAEADAAGRGIWVWFEFEHEEVGLAASSLALSLLQEAEPALQPPAPSGDAKNWQADNWAEFLAFARPLVLPRDTEAIIRAALRRDIPCFKLERTPYVGLSGDFRIRPNGLLCLGHSAHRLLLDGTVCVNRAERTVPLLRRPAARQEALRRLGLPVSLPNEAGSAAPGSMWRLLMAGEQPIAVLAEDRPPEMVQGHLPALDLARRIARGMGAGLFIVTLAGGRHDRLSPATSEVVLDVDFAPNLDRELSEWPEILDAAADAFIDWLHPRGTVARIPVVAVTGTNGKTTTCRMIERIARQAGFSTGLDCSDGLYFDGQRAPAEVEENCARFYPIFEQPELNFAVLEEYFGVVLRSGFANAFSDVAVCTNVTADHLGRIGIHTLEQMAEVKHLVVSRAREGAVLNADNAATLAMLPHLRARCIGLVSRTQSAAELAGLLDRPGLRCVIEPHDGENWLVVHEQNQRIALMAERQIPATFDGAAGHNTSNAMQAALACLLLGIDYPAVRAGLADFEMGFETTPGRLNLFPGLPFTVLMDYAHNEDGFRVLTEFAGRLAVTGRRRLMFGFTDDRREEDIVRAASVLAGHFDTYVCRNFREVRGQDHLPDYIPGLLRRGLMQAGVSADKIRLVPDPDEARRVSIEMARAGDLLVLLVGSSEFDTLWAELEALKQATGGGKPIIPGGN